MSNLPVSSGPQWWELFARLARWLRSRLSADHAAIGSLHTTGDRMHGFYLVLAAAPARWPSRPPDGALVSAAASFLQIAAPGTFPGSPTESYGDVVRFRVPHDDFSPARAAEVHQTGYVEILWRLERIESGDRVELSLMEIAAVVSSFADALGSEAFGRLARGRWLARRRIDVRMNMTAYETRDSGSEPWTAIRFPASVPPRAAQARPYVSTTGYGQRTLRSWPRHRTPSRLVTLLLQEMLERNGYYALDGVVAEVLSAAQGRGVAVH